ncbi:hypothetical protein HCMG_01238 [Helicobacter canadensis MIT 98-5491]|nr:hypothetical protein HCMG_01238 [Helicobacter canadensis MIT 98-5491]
MQILYIMASFLLLLILIATNILFDSFLSFIAYIHYLRLP